MENGGSVYLQAKIENAKDKLLHDLLSIVRDEPPKRDETKDKTESSGEKDNTNKK